MSGLSQVISLSLGLTMVWCDFLMPRFACALGLRTWLLVLWHA